MVIVPCRLEVSFFLEGELDKDMLKGYSISLSIHEQQLATSEGLEPVTIQLPMDQTNQL